MDCDQISIGTRSTSYDGLCLGGFSGYSLASAGIGISPKKDLKIAIELTEKETGCIIEIVTLAALETGTNVVVYGYVKEVSWYQQ